MISLSHMTFHDEHLLPLLHPHHGIKKLLVPSFLYDRMVSKLKVLKKEEERKGVVVLNDDPEVGVVVKGYKDLEELLVESLTTTTTATKTCNGKRSSRGKGVDESE